MTGVLTLFLISLFGLVLMFGLKMYELSFGKSIYPISLRDDADNLLNRLIEQGHQLIIKISKISILHISSKGLEKTNNAVNLLYKKAKNSDNKVTNFIKGKRILERKETQSDFLDDIEQHKRNNGGGEIEG